MADIGFGGFITLQVGVSDLKKAIAWYTKKLGLELSFKVPEAGWAEVATPTKNVTFGLNANAETGGDGGFAPVLSVDDIAKAVSTLKRRKVKVDDIFEIPGMVKLATFYDADGNRLMLSESQN